MSAEIIPGDKDESELPQEDITPGIDVKITPVSISREDLIPGKYYLESFTIHIAPEKPVKVSRVKQLPSGEGEKAS